MNLCGCSSQKLLAMRSTSSMASREGSTLAMSCRQAGRGWGWNGEAQVSRQKSGGSLSCREVATMAGQALGNEHHTGCQVGTEHSKISAQRCCNSKNAAQQQHPEPPSPEPAPAAAAAAQTGSPAHSSAHLHVLVFQGIGHVIRVAAGRAGRQCRTGRCRPRQAGSGAGGRNQQQQVAACTSSQRDCHWAVANLCCCRRHCILPDSPPTSPGAAAAGSLTGSRGLRGR